MNLDYYKQAILNHFESVETTGMFLAGGALTSMFSGKEINDLDLYPKSKKVVGDFLDQSSLHILAVTDKALSCVKNTSGYTSKSMQVIYFKTFESAQEIFDCFDFTINMAAFDFDKEEFIFHPDFFKDLASKTLTFNHGTSFPLISGMRVNKYLSRGYNISRSEHRKLLMEISKLDLSNKQDFIKHMGGMYSMQAMIEIMLWPENEPFSEDKALEKIQDFMKTEPKLFFGKDPYDLKSKIAEENVNPFSCNAEWLTHWFWEDEEHQKRLETNYWVESRKPNSDNDDRYIQLFKMNNLGKAEVMEYEVCKSVVYMLFYPEQQDQSLKILCEMIKNGESINALTTNSLDYPF